jgi:asparagine N-glycosylation enzyme membrane subunit Stt3
MHAVLLGAIAMASLVAALFFLRFWTVTQDRFFLLFAMAFFVEALNRAALGVTTVRAEQEPFFYLVRLCAFGLIIAAILDKNRASPAATNVRGHPRRTLCGTRKWCGAFLQRRGR